MYHFVYLMECVTFLFFLYYAFSGRGLPHLYASLDAAFLQIDFGQEHVTCLSILASVMQRFVSAPPTPTGSEPTGEFRTDSLDHAHEGPEFLVLSQSFDDIRAGCFKYITDSGGDVVCLTGELHVFQFDRQSLGVEVSK